MVIHRSRGSVPEDIQTRWNRPCRMSACSWARVGDQIRYPEGHFCQQAMACLDAVLVENLRDEPPRAPTQGSLDAARKNNAT